MTTDLILGTAGHIDHGKTSLIRALTGVDTDRLPEEKKRGITIELGFAELNLGNYRLGVVDVPGHERFVRNMLAGATGMDIAMLVVAADDSIKPQTREHLEILRLLNLEQGLVALTKCDLVEPDWLDLVEEEIRELVSDTFLADAPIVRTSAETRLGLDELKEKLTEAAEHAAESTRMNRIHAPFRMPIDRTFTIAGHGTVVTGSVASGQVSVGDELLIEPGAISVRVRGLQNHDRTADSVHRGQRAAINLAGVHHDETVRGQELTSPGHLVPSRLLSAQITMLASVQRPLKNRARVRVHVGTAEILSSVRLLDRERLEAGARAPVQLFLSQAAVTTWKQPFVIRSESPVLTIGGGHVLDPCAEKIRKVNDETLKFINQLSSTETVERASAALYFAGFRNWDPSQLARTAGIDDVATAAKQLAERGDLNEITISPTRSIRLHQRVFEQLCDRIAATLLRMHEENPLRSVLNLSQLLNAFSYLSDEALLRAALNHMRQEKRIKISDRGIALVGQGPKLSNNEEKVLNQIVDLFRNAGLKPPTVKECQQAVTKNRDSVPQLVELAANNGDLVKIADDFYLHAETEAGIREKLTNGLSANDGKTMSQIRECLDTSRKYAVPLCEYFDAIGFTHRDGDLRRLAKPVTEPQ